MSTKFTIKVCLMVLLLSMMICISQTIVAQSNTKENVKSEKSNITITLLVPLFTAVLGGFAGAGISIWFSKRQARKEYRSLILAFCSELVLVYERCVMYYAQAKKPKPEVSYSALFSFTDSSALSKFASVCPKPEVVAEIIEIKSMYFQIQRHVEEAARFAVEASRSKDPKEQQDLMEKAFRAQGTALAFFRGFYERIERKTGLIVEAAKKVSPGNVPEDLYSRFLDAKKERQELDSQKS
jgi:Zn-dependent protease with chaperone function